MNLKLASRQVGVFVIVIAFWAFADLIGLFNPNVIPPISQVFTAFGEIWARNELFGAVWFTTRDSLLGLAIAAALAIPLGLGIGMFPKVEISTRILLDFGRSFPVIALVPIFILVIGTNHQTKVTMIAIACFFPILVQAIYGARRLDPTIQDTVAGFQIPPLMRFRRVILPYALPFIATGLRLSFSIAILVAIAAEILTQVPGLGAKVNLARTYNEVDIAFAYTLVAGLLGVTLSGLWDVIETRLLSWHHREVSL